jgi:fructokinase
MVVFEPSSESDPNLLSEALAAAHIVKVASDRLSGNEVVLKAKTPLLLIETRGAAGLRYSHTPAGGRRAWKTLPAFRSGTFRDSAGAGDWCTAGIISTLGTIGPDGLAKTSPGDVQSALLRGQAMAAWTCRYDGARGGMYASSKKEFDQRITDILSGKTDPHEKLPVDRRTRSLSDTIWCDCCVPGA